MKVIVNVGGGWNPIRSAFIAPITGYYFFSYSIGLRYRIGYPSPIVALRMGATDVCILAGGAAQLLRGGNIDTASRSCMIKLIAGDEVITAMTKISNVFSSAQLPLITFSGFLYRRASTAWVWHLDNSANLIMLYCYVGDIVGI